jgi:hypothetical protein
MNKLIKSLTGIATSKVGTHEATGKNDGAEIIVFQKATNLNPGNWPWCAAFCCWVLKELLLLPEALDHFYLTTETTETFRCKSANTTGWINWAKKRNFQVLNNSNLAKAGDFCIFDFQLDGKNDHIGIVIKNQTSINETITTVEGNTNDAGSAEGDGVYIKHRNPLKVTNYIRIIQEQSA